MTWSEFESKKYAFYLIVLLVFLMLVIQFFNLQISQSSHYTEKSYQNSVKMITQFPVRGNIYDRNGRIIVDNRPAYSLYLIPAETPNSTITKMVELFELSEEEILQEFKKAGKFQPVKIVRQVDLEKLIWIQENIVDLPGVEWKSEPIRHYVQSSGLAHLLGTLGEIDEKELRFYPQLEAGDVVGKKALEKTFDDQIRGVKGVKFVKVDAAGRVVDQLSTSKSVLPFPGKHLYLSIDLRLQIYADSLMEGKRGALIALDTRNGEILTFLSKPDYDVSKLSGIISSQLWEELVNDPYHPLYDRACQSGYPPGSTYKLIAAVAALNENIITPARRFTCPGYYVIGNKVVKCWQAKGHGTLDLEGAIKNSCNVYFYQLGMLIGLDIWNKYSELFLFGKKTGIELTNENQGLVPSVPYYDRVYGKGKWTKGMLANLAIGQGELLVTPLQMVQFTSILANRGKWYQPHLALKLEDPITKRQERLSAKTGQIEGIKPAVFDIILEGMREVIDGGTGGRARLYGLTSAGKTGTAQNPHGDAHAWYIGFAPFENPEIAICVLIENGGSGGAVSAPIAGAYLKKYFFYQNRYDYEIERKILAAAAKKDSIQNLPASIITSSMDSVQAGN
jgi:penicillin-binding protein 2